MTWVDWLLPLALFFGGVCVTMFGYEIKRAREGGDRRTEEKGIDRARIVALESSLKHVQEDQRAHEAQMSLLANVRIMVGRLDERSKRTAQDLGVMRKHVSVVGRQNQQILSRLDLILPASPESTPTHRHS